jgi:hypothetical protein
METFKEMSKTTDYDIKDNLQFIRKGVVGGYRNEMSQEYIDRFDKWMQQKDILNQGFKYKGIDETTAAKRSSIMMLIKQFQY